MEQLIFVIKNKPEETLISLVQYLVVVFLAKWIILQFIKEKRVN